MDGDMRGVNEKAKGMSGFASPLFLSFVFCLFPLNFAFASETLPDPTRPPAEAGLAGEIATVTSGPVLQSVKIAPGHRMAVIGGQLLAEGDRFGTAKLVSVTESEVVLQGPEGRQMLKLFPGVEKHVTNPLTDQPAARGKNKSKRKTEQKAP